LLFKDNKIIKVDRETAYDILKGKWKWKSKQTS
jgi:hypothetical protein